MTTETTKETKAPARKATSDRDDRLKAALKANMGRRKAQARARASDPAESAAMTRGESRPEEE